MLLLQALHSPLRIYLNVIIILHVSWDGLIYANVLKHFNLISVLTFFNLPDVPNFGVNVISRSLLVLFTILIIDVK